VEIDQDLLNEAVRDSGESANAEEVTAALGPSADDGRYWDVTTVANDLAELESLGKLERTRPVPVALPQDDSAPQRRDDIPQESTAAAADEEEDRPFFQRIGSRAVWLPLAFVAALLVGFGSMTVLLRVADWPGQSDTKPAPTTAVPAAPPPSAAGPAVTTPPASTSPPAVENEPAPPAPEPAPPAAAPAPAPPESAPNPNPAGKVPPGQNKKQ
jgi:hypothetical protein